MSAFQEAAVRDLEEAYLLMTDGPDAEGMRRARIRVCGALEALLDLREQDGDSAVYATVGRLTPGALRLLAAQAVVELGLLDEWSPWAEPEEEEPHDRGING